MADPRRRIRIRITGDAVREGRVPVRLFTAKLRGLQNALLQIAFGKTESERDPSRGGRRPSSLTRQCELFLVETSRDSFGAVLELPRPDPTLFEEYPDRGEEAAADLRRVLQSIANNDPEGTAAVLPRPPVRRLVLKTLQLVLPGARDDYGIEIAVGEEQPLTNLVRPNQEQLQRLIAAPELSPEPTETELRLIRATCLARFDEAGRPDVKEVLEYDVLDEHQYRPSEVQWGSRRFVLSHEIACSVTREGELWVIEYEPLGICAYAKTREDAIHDFADDFAAIWDAYAQASDSELSEDAIALKRVLRSLVKETVDVI